MLPAISESSVARTPWGRDWKQTWQKEALGLRVRARLEHGNLEGNIIHVEGSQVHESRLIPNVYTHVDTALEAALKCVTRALVGPYGPGSSPRFL